MESRPDQMDRAPEPEPPVTSDIPTPDPGTAEAPGVEILPLEGVLPSPVVAAVVGANRTRWLIGGAVAVAAVVLLALAATLLGARPVPEALTFVPANSAVVLELRPELPGDQREQLGLLLAKFPGFADRSILDQKIDEVLDRAVREGSGGSVDYTTQVKPLLAGPMALALSPDGLREAMTGGSPAGVLLVATTDGNVTCAALGGPGTVLETYRGTELLRIGRETTCALDGRFMLLGDAAAVKGGLDARRDGGGLNGDATYKAALAELDGDRLGTVFVSGTAMASLVPDGTMMFGLNLPETAFPAWIIGGLRAEGDALVLDAIAAPVSEPRLASGAPTTAPAAESRFAGVLPPDTLGYAEVHGVGAALTQALAAVRADPAAAEALGQVDAALAMLGGADNLVGWIEDAGIAVIPTADGVGVALLIQAADAEAAAARVAQVRNLLVFAAAGTDITVRETERSGVTITTVDLGDLGSLLGALGGLAGPGGLGDLGLGDLGLGDLGPPADAGAARIVFDLAARDDLVLITVGDGTAGRILDVEAASSLQKTAGYARAITLAGSRNNLQAYLALDAVMAVAEGLATGPDLDTWNREIAPYAEHLAGLAWSSTSSKEGSRARIVLTVK